MLREETTPNFEKNVCHAARAKSGNKSAFAQADNRAEKQKAQNCRSSDDENIYSHTQRSERPSPTVHHGKNKTFGRQNAKSCVDHARNAQSRQNSSGADLNKLQAVARRIKKRRRPHCQIKDGAEKRADRKLLDSLDEKSLGFHNGLQNKEKSVCGKYKQPDAQSCFLRKHNSCRAYGAGSQAGMLDVLPRLKTGDSGFKRQMPADAG